MKCFCFHLAGADGMDVVEYADGMDPASDENRIVLHEDKKYYPESSEVYPGILIVMWYSYFVKLPIHNTASE